MPPRELDVLYVELCAKSEPRANLLGMLLTVCALLAATTVDVLPLAELAERSDVVARVRVEAVTENANARMTTMVVERAFQGARAGERITLFQPLYRGSLVAGAHAFRPGEIKIVFLGRHVLRDGTRVVVQMAPGLGVFRVDAGADGGVREEVGDVVDIATLKPPAPRAFADEAAFVRAIRR